MNLDSWHEGPARTAVLDFLGRVTTEDGPDFVPTAERIAVFDNDGTLWCERPAYAQAAFLLDELHDQVPAGLEEITKVLVETHAGLTVAEYGARVRGWFATARHPRFGVGWDALAYVPMLELLAELRKADFAVFIVTGGGVEFVRAVSERVYGITPAAVVGSAVEVRLERRERRVELVRRAQLRGSPNEGAAKVVNIQAHLGRRPIVAAGNSPGDREMLEYVQGEDRPSLCLVVDHDDDEREYAYASASITDPEAAPILDTAADRGWTVVSMRRDWRQVFSGDRRP